MAAGLGLEVLAGRISLRARRPIQFPVPASNRFRGALGFQLPEELFRPSAADGPSGFRDRPRPFVLRCRDLDAACLETGESFSLDLHLFTGDSKPFQYAFEHLSWAELVDWRESSHSLLLDEPVPPAEKLRVSFVTPTELKPHHGPGPPPFAILLARARDRIAALRLFYGKGPLEFDFRAQAEQAAAVLCTDGCVQWETAERQSGRSGQVHPLGGFTGFADYSGDLGSFLPWLEAARWTGIGRHTVWGKGVTELQILRPEPPASS